MPNYSNKSDSIHQAWLDWMLQVEKPARDRIAKKIREVDLTQPQGLVLLSQELMAMVAEGKLSIAVSTELREWGRLIHDEIVAATVVKSANGTNMVGQINMFMAAAVNAEKPRLQEDLLADADWSRSVNNEKLRVLNQQE